MKKKFTIYLFSALALLFAFSSINLEAQSQSDTKKPIKYKKARALQTSTAKKMAKVYEALEEVDDAVIRREHRRRRLFLALALLLTLDVECLGLCIYD